MLNGLHRLLVLWERNSVEQQYGIREVWTRDGGKVAALTIYHL
jgi:hypothetical protein